MMKIMTALCIALIFTFGSVSASRADSDIAIRDSVGLSQSDLPPIPGKKPLTPSQRKSRVAKFAKASISVLSLAIAPQFNVIKFGLKAVGFILRALVGKEKGDEKGKGSDGE